MRYLQNKNSDELYKKGIWDTEKQIREKKVKLQRVKVHEMGEG
jgi:hypothetical protein